MYSYLDIAPLGLFQGMFEKNILTFNPGWDSNAQRLATSAMPPASGMVRTYDSVGR